MKFEDHYLNGERVIRATLDLSISELMQHCRDTAASKHMVEFVMTKLGAELAHVVHAELYQSTFRDMIQEEIRAQVKTEVKHMIALALRDAREDLNDRLEEVFGG